MTDPEPCFDI